MKKVVMILVPLALIGAVVGLAMMGIINIPGLTPAKKGDWKASLLKTFKAHGSIKGDTVVFKDASPEEKKAFVAAATAGGLDPVASDAGVKSAKLIELLKKEGGSPPVAVKPKAKTTSPAPAAKVASKPTTTVKPELGAEAIAEVWATMDTEKLLKIVEKYKDPELATILLKMDTGRTAEILGAMDSVRAAGLSREIQKQSSVVALAASKG